MGKRGQIRVKNRTEKSRKIGDRKRKTSQLPPGKIERGQNKKKGRKEKNKPTSSASSQNTFTDPDTVLVVVLTLPGDRDPGRGRQSSGCLCTREAEVLEHVVPRSLNTSRCHCLTQNENFSNRGISGSGGEERRAREGGKVENKGGKDEKEKESSSKRASKVSERVGPSWELGNPSHIPLRCVRVSG